MRKTVWGVALASAILLGAWGHAFAAEATIKVGHLADMTGPTGDVGKPYAEGVQEYVKLINSKGGINGKKIDMPVFDYAYNKDKAIQQYKKYKEEKVVAIQGWGTGDTEALSGFVGGDKIPYISASYSAHLADPKKTPYNFFTCADYTTMARAGLKYLKDNWKEKRAPKVVFIYPNHPYGIAPIKGAKEYAKEIGFEVLSDENVDLKAIEANSQLLSVKSKGADFAWVGGTTGSTAVILKDAKKLGLATKFFVNLWGMDETTPKLATGAEEGAYLMAGSVIFGSKAPGMKEIEAANPGEGAKVNSYVRGWVSSMVMVEALKIADKKGPITGESLKAALETLKDYDPAGLTPDKITFTPTDHRPHGSTYIYQFEKGKLVEKGKITLPMKAEWLGL